jgi:cyclophilin family peptidyl-prolyl cis-trans isomerase
VRVVAGSRADRSGAGSVRYRSCVPNPRAQREQERLQRLAEAERANRSAKRKQIAVAVMCGVMIVAVVAAIVIAGTRGSTKTATTGTTATTDPRADLPDRQSTTTPPTGPPASLPAVAAGATAAGQPPCPAEDGSSARTTSFPQGIPTCTTPGTDYLATVHTSGGDIKFLLNQAQGAQTVNSFLVLARYHYWDGAPFTNIVPNKVGIVGNPVADGPGYTLPNEAPSVGNIFELGYLALVAGSGTTVDPATLQIELGQDAADLPKNTPVFGLMLDGIEVLQKIRAAGSQSGVPTGVVTIQSIDIVVSPSSSATSAPPKP